MTSPIRILDTGLKSARWNVAMTAALTTRHADGTTPDTIRFHRYRECVLLGRTQRAAEAVDLEHCRLRAIEIVHRVTGGGAAWDVVIDRRSLTGDLGTATRRICEGIAGGLSRLGCVAGFRPANDVEIGGLKVSGSSGYAEGRSLALLGTILPWPACCAYPRPSCATGSPVSRRCWAWRRRPPACSPAWWKG